jgi:hypothetical protein
MQFEGLSIGECEIAHERYCTKVAELREDPFEADVNNNPGVMVWACDACLQELAGDI